jgi:hypothetical protein
MSSEEVELKINELNISKSFSEKEFQRKTYWDCCSGSKIDKRCVQFFSQLTISLIVIIFSLYQLYRETNTDIYLSLLTMIIGIYTEAPRL